MGGPGCGGLLPIRTGCDALPTPWRMRGSAESTHAAARERAGAQHGAPDPGTRWDGDELAVASRHV
eukprot:10851773-Lingulodinium_polyedra.AAC.1